MIIRTQDRKSIVTVNAIQIDEKNTIIGSKGKTTYLLGKYQTKSRCFAILEEIEETLSLFANTKAKEVYRMPEK